MGICGTNCRISLKMSAFTLTVGLGSIIHSSGHKSQVLDGVPENAQELWESGTSFLVLKKDGAELLNDYSETKLKELLKIRTAAGFPAELELIEKAIKGAGKKAAPKKEDK